MKLSLDEIRQVTVGALHVFCENSGIRFLKMTDRQLNAFREISEGQYQGALTTSGVRLDFWTDSPFLAFQTLTDGKYEVKIDGLLLDAERREAGKKYRVPVSRDGCRHRVTLALPSHSCGILSCVELADGASLERHSFDSKMLFIGDSLTQGWNSEYDTCSWAWVTSDHFNAESIIQGIGGARYDESTVDHASFTPDTVIVAYGTNDASGALSVAEVEEKCHAALEKIKLLYADARIVVITPVWRLDYDVLRPYGHVEAISHAIAREAQALGLFVVDGMKLVPHIDSLFVDNVHPNDLGFAFYAHNLIKILEKIL